jgi:hypothetical protein
VWRDTPIRARAFSANPMFVRRYTDSECWVCGSREKLTREHKIKASDLRRQYGKRILYIQRDQGESATYRIAQSSNSKHFKFSNPICETCNTSRTQVADRAYDALISNLEMAVQTGKPLEEAISSRNIPIDIFRYFGKLLGCHLADVNAPIPLYLSKFVAGTAGRNCIHIWTRFDPDFEKITPAKSPEGKYIHAAHGGLVISTKAPKLYPIEYRSTVSIGAIQFVFWYCLTIHEILETRIGHSDFVNSCKQDARAAIENPMLEDDRRRLGYQ